MNEEVQKITEVPNGDISKAITEFNGVRRGIHDRAETDGGISAKDMAMFIAASKTLSDKIKHYVDLYTEALRNAGIASYDFVELGKTVAVAKGRAITEIDGAAFDYLNTNELRIAAKLTEKGLKEAKRSDLIDKFKHTTGESALTVTVKTIK